MTGFDRVWRVLCLGLDPRHLWTLEKRRTIGIRLRASTSFVVLGLPALSLDTANGLPFPVGGRPSICRSPLYRQRTGPPDLPANGPSSRPRLTDRARTAEKPLNF